MLSSSSFLTRIFVAGLTTTLALTTVAQETARPIKALFITGGCCHDYENQKRILTEGIAARAKVEWTIIHEGGSRGDHRISVYTNADWAKGYDVILHDECFADVKDADFVRGILKAHRDGVPAVNLHCAMHCYRVDFEKFKDWFEFTGLDTRGHGAQLPIQITYVKTDHPITRGLENWTTIKEELYNNIGVMNTATPLARGKQSVPQKEGAPKEVDCMVTWINSYHGTRIFNTTIGHNNETCSDARYLDLVTRGLLWACDKLGTDGKPKAGYGVK